MLPDLNPPLRIGQVLKSRDPSRPSFKIVELCASSPQMLWGVANVAGGPVQKMTLAEIYAEFLFEN